MNPVVHDAADTTRLSCATCQTVARLEMNLIKGPRA